MNNMEKIWLPNKNIKALEYQDIVRWYDNIKIELQSNFLTNKDKQIISNYYRNAGLYDNPLKKSFFHHHFSYKLATVISLLHKEGIENKKILDLGCGIGTQSLLFSILGGEVIALDTDDDSLRILRLRKEFYEHILKKTLPITIIKANALNFNYPRYGPFDVVYSLFSFNLMQPTKELLNLLTPSISPDAFFIVQDGNKNMWFNKLFRKRNVLSKNELQSELKKSGFHEITSMGGYAVPPIFWFFIPSFILQRIDSILSKSDFFSGSYLYIAKK